MSAPGRNTAAQRNTTQQPHPSQQPHTGRQDLPPWAEHMKYISQEEYDRETQQGWDDALAQHELENRGDWRFPRI